MGAESSSSAKKPVLSNLSKDQIQNLSEQLKKRTNGKECVNKRVFEDFFPKLQPITSQLFSVVEDGGRCNFSDLFVLIDSLLGDAGSQAALLLKMFGSPSQALENVVAVYSRRHELTAAEAGALRDHLLSEVPEDESRFGRWLVGNCVAEQLILHVFAPLVLEKGPSLLPLMSCKSLLLSHSAALVINMYLPIERRKQWTLLFSSAQDGESFSQICKCVNGEGACVVVVRSSNGRIFGCFASAGFIMGPNYQGDATSFLFEVEPQLRIFFATGRTENYAYLNCQQVSLPNGLGIGGYENVWPFFIDEDYGRGVTFANISSFEKCHLSGGDHFELNSLEIWRVGEKPIFLPGEDPKRSEKSVIDKDPEARALLEMSGHKMHSDAHREPAPLLDEPFEI